MPAPQSGAGPTLTGVRPPPRLRLARLPTPFEPLDRLSALLGGPRDRAGADTGQAFG